MTVAILMENTLKSAERLWEISRERKIKPLPLTLLEKVPSDIEIAMAQTPKPVTQLAQEIGLLPDELESYGKYKAKVELSVLERLAHRTDGKYIVIAGCELSYLEFNRMVKRIAVSPLHLLERASLPPLSGWPRLWEQNWGDLLSLVLDSPVKDQRSESKVAQLVVDTVRSFLWMKYVLIPIHCILC